MGMGIVYLGDMMLRNSMVSGTISFWRDEIFAGQFWRVISFVLVPPGGNILPPVVGLQSINNVMQPLFVLISLYFMYMAGKYLENTWGAFRFNLYIFSGIIFAIIGGFISPLGISSNSYMLSSLFLALATLMPSMQVRLFFLIPIRGWLFLLIFFAMNLFSIIEAFTIPMIGGLIGVSNLIVFALSLVPYFAFFGKSLISNARQQIMIIKNRRQWNNRNR
jgi:hypothetical protein